MKKNLVRMFLFQFFFIYLKSCFVFVHTFVSFQLFQINQFGLNWSENTQELNVFATEKTKRNQRTHPYVYNPLKLIVFFLNLCFCWLYFFSLIFFLVLPSLHSKLCKVPNTKINAPWNYLQYTRDGLAACSCGKIDEILKCNSCWF